MPVKNMKKGIKLALELALISGVLVAGTSILPKKYQPVVPQKMEKIIIQENAEAKDLQIPIYSLESVNAGNCSKYVRLCADETFDKTFSRNSAWNRRYHDKVIVPFGEIRTFEDLECLANEGKLKPGMIIGVYNPSSTHNGELDERGSILKYTHNLLYLGKTFDEKMLFCHQYGKTSEVSDIAGLKARNLRPREVIDTK
jgi:hypothetical protein